MLIKEYRIPLPLTLEEYSIAQLYMIQVLAIHCCVLCVLYCYTSIYGYTVQWDCIREALFLCHHRAFPVGDVTPEGTH